MENPTSNHFKFQLMKKQIDMDNDVFKMALMATGFTFDKADHATYADVSASEVSSGNGYVTGGVTMGECTVTEDDVNDQARASFADASFEPDSGDIGPTVGGIIYDNTLSDKTVVGFVDFVTERTFEDGKAFVVQNIKVLIS